MLSSDASIHASTPEQILTIMLGLMQKLKAVYSAEVDAIIKNDTQSFIALQPDKMALSRDYELRVKEIAARAAAIKASDPILRQKVIAEQTELEILADRSQRAALRMAEGIRHLQERLIDAARHSITQEKIQYTHRGAMSGADIGKPVATAINEAI